MKMNYHVKRDDVFIVFCVRSSYPVAYWRRDQPRGLALLKHSVRRAAARKIDLLFRSILQNYRAFEVDAEADFVGGAQLDVLGAALRHCIPRAWF